MKHTIVVITFLLLNLCNAHSQSASPDKNKVMGYFQNQQFEEAIAYLVPALAADSANLELLGFMGYAFYMIDNSREARKYYQKMFNIDSVNTTANQYLALLNSNSNPVLAQPFTRRLIRLQPNKALFYRNLADLFKKLNQKDSALIYFREAYTRSPNDAKNAAGLADILIDKKNYLLADSILDKSLARDSGNSIFLKLKIRAAYEAKDYLKAVVPGEKLLTMNDVSMGALTQLAVAYYNLSRYEDCIRVCTYMLSNDLDAESIFYYQAKAWAKLKNYTESNDLLQVCLGKALSKTAELYYFNLGENYEALKQYGAAVKEYDTAFYLFKNPLMKYYPARVYGTFLRNEKMAKKYYVQYLTLAVPETADEKKAYQYIHSRYGRK